MVESKLISDSNPNIPRPLELEKYLPFYDQLKTKKCKSCNQAFSTSSQIFHYVHSSGWIVPGYEKKQWLYIKCANCGEEISLWKLGVGKNLLPIEHKNNELQNVWKEKSHPGALEHHEISKEKSLKKISKEQILEDLGKACIEKTELQQQLGQIQVFCENRLIDLGKPDPNWNIDYIPEEMLKRGSEVNSLNSILNLLKSH